MPKLANAGADRVVNPQELGAARMASLVARPHVAAFIAVGADDDFRRLSTMT